MSGGIATPERRTPGRVFMLGATESMLVWDPATKRYDASATPCTGKDALREHYAKLVRGEWAGDRGTHAVF